MMNMPRQTPRDDGASTAALVSWASYDWGHSAFPTVVETFLFAAYFTRQIAPDPIQGSAQWGMTVGCAGLIVALSAPLLGAIADQGGRRKPWITFFTFLCAAATAFLWFAKPSAEYAVFALLLVGIGTVAAECAFVFYNAMLPTLAPPERMGRWSGWAWGIGYCGGLTCLAVALLLMSRVGSDATQSADVRAAFPLAAAWLIVFSLPLLLITPDARGRRKPFRRAIGDGARQLIQTIRHARRYRGLVRFLIAQLVYIDGLTTLFLFGGVYAAGTFGMSERDVLLFGIALNVSAGIGAAAFSWLDDALGSRRTILLSLAGLIVTSSATLLVQSATLFWVFGCVLGLFVGPTQAASRSYLARAAPANVRSEMFGLYALAGKATAFAGPMLVGLVTQLAGSQRIGLGVVVALLILGFALMLRTPEAHAPADNREVDAVP
jgi:UMF1 family MFS transporter